MFKILFLILNLGILKCSIAQDSLFLDRNLNIFNSSVEKVIFDSAKYDTAFEFNGYLIITINNHSKIEMTENRQSLFSTEVFFVDSISQIEESQDFYNYYSAFGSIIQYQVMGYDKGFINKMTAFAKYYSMFNRANKEDVNIFLYNRNGILQTNLLIENENILTGKKNDKNNYLIFKCKFFTVVLNFHLPDCSRKVFLPISKLNEFTQVTVQEAIDLGFIKSNLVIKPLGSTPKE